jgi:hypothetical protein
MTNVTEHRRINLGCGFDHRPGYLNVDFQEFHNPDLKADVRDLSALKDETYEEALALDVIEHLERAEVVPALREWRRVLIPGGTLRLRTADLMGIGLLLAQRDELALHQAMVQGAYGTQAYSGDYHLAGFTDLTLIDQLFEAGFERIRLERMHGWLLLAEAHRATSASTDPLAVALRHGVFETEYDGDYAWRWCDQEANILLYARTGGPIHVRLELDVSRPGDGIDVEVHGTGLRHRTPVSGVVTVSTTLDLVPGPNRISITAHGAPIDAPGDPRSLWFQLLDVRAQVVDSVAD